MLWLRKVSVQVGLQVLSTQYSNGRGETMNARVDAEARRKRYAMHRLGLAMKRLMNAEAETEKLMATRWVNAWSASVGERWFAASPYGRLSQAALMRVPVNGSTGSRNVSKSGRQSSI